MRIQAKIHQRTVEHQVELGRKCKKLRQLGVTPPCLCERFGVSIKTIRKWIAKAEEKKKR